MRVAAIQPDTVWEDPGANFARLEPMIATAAAGGARLVALTEMFSTGFSMDTATIAEPPGGVSSTFLVEQAVRHDVWICGSIAEFAPGATRPGNVAILAAPDGTVHRYTKIHPFSYAHEDEHYVAGDSFLTVDIEGVRVTVFVCYDLRFANEFWARAPETDCYLVVANWPASRAAHWPALLRARAIENQAYVIDTNRVGTGNGVEYAGGSVIVDPFGVELAAAGGEETTVDADVDPARVAEVRARYPFLPDRREIPNP